MSDTPRLRPWSSPGGDYYWQMMKVCDALLPKFELAFKRELRFRMEVKLEFPQLLADWLLALAQRTRLLGWSLIRAVNDGDELVMMLVARALLENAASVAYTHEKLRKTYRREIARKEMGKIVVGLRFGIRDQLLTAEWSEHDRDVLKPVNVLTKIECLDAFISETLYRNTNWTTRQMYETLCEFAHPNCFGISSNNEILFGDGEQCSVFEWKPAIREHALRIAAEPCFMALALFVDLHNRCWTFLMENGETLPEMIPAGDPRIEFERLGPWAALGE